MQGVFKRNIPSIRVVRGSAVLLYGPVPLTLVPATRKL